MAVGRINGVFFISERMFVLPVHKKSIRNNKVTVLTGMFLLRFAEGSDPNPRNWKGVQIR